MMLESRAESSPRPLNSLGVWINNVSIAHNMPQTQMGEFIELPGIKSLKTANPTTISLYSMKRLMEGARIIGCNPEEIYDLARRESELIEQQMRERGGVIEKTPPRAIAAIARRLSNETRDTIYYYNTQLSREVLGEDATPRQVHAYEERIRVFNRKHGYASIVTAEQGLQIINGITQADEKKRTGRTWISLAKELHVRHSKVHDVAISLGLAGEHPLNEAQVTQITVLIKKSQQSRHRRPQSA